MSPQGDAEASGASGADLEAGDPRELREALRHQTDRLATLCATVPGVICTFGIRADGTVMLPYATAGLAAIYGREGIGPGVSPLYEHLHADDVDWVRASLIEAVRGTSMWHAEFRIRHLTHGERWIEGAAAPRREPAGDVFWHGYFQDITRRKRAERRFAVQHAVGGELANARSLIDAAPRVLALLCEGERYARGVFWEVDAEADVLHRRAVWPADDACAPAIGARDAGVASRAWATGAPIVGDDGLALPIALDGRVLGVLELAGGEPRPASDALIGSLSAVSRQVAQFAERMRTEAALRDSERRLWSVIEHLSEGVVVTALDGRIVHWNPAALELYGISPGDDWRSSVAGVRSSFSLETLDGVPVTGDALPLARMVRGEVLRQHELRIRRRDSAWTRVFSFGGSLVTQADGSQLAVLSIADITERVRATEELHHLNTELEQRVTARTAELESANRELESFSYSVAHDLRTPLRSVSGFAQLVIEDFGSLLPADGQRLLGVVRDSAQRMGRLIDDLLRFAQLGRQPIARRRIDMAALVRSVFTELVAASPGRAEVQIAELPPCEADPALVRQIWANLISNALKYSRMRDPARIEIGFEVGAATTIYFVRDNGVGFAMSFAHMLFGVFQRLHSQDEFEGTGVGLAIVHRIVERHDGKVWAVGAVDHGATFCFTLERGV